ncbi:iron ABC transporter ATP-binding protein [Paenibacillus yonginensis]|uniref:Iron ABC transporter ATP-binding protein n=1 Tax=Paenibacillus yonginensis TaxID=1462996 RepID=A0A1B1MZ29_9BACL|nr:ABC transporter ATP-binding protein [Paenibacillus yonginensis]ANS74426.1 iron ABC transporter ATP-binding protein [Paenibacillus yonginensis]
MSILSTSQVTLKYGGKAPVIRELSLSIEQGKVYSIIGPNGCGKSTLLKALSKQMKVPEGQVFYQEQNMKQMKPKQVAQKLSYLAQSNEPADLTVRELVAYGRSPHQSLLSNRKEEDERIIDWALKAASLKHLEHRNIEGLSGGERQRAWIAMSLAQKTDVLLLDEPTTYLDIHHQMEILELTRQLNRELSMTVLLVLHDINQACQFSDELIVMREGQIYARGVPEQIMNAGLLKEVFGVTAAVQRDEQTGRPYCRIIGRDRTADSTP